MSVPSHQTIKLSKGRHPSPREGACVMELASMLAGEEFSDHPVSVCPVIGSFLRAYNDSIDDRRRQDLYAYAAAVVGTRTTDAVRDARLARLAEWTAQQRQLRRPFWMAGPLRRVGTGRVRSPGAVAALAVGSIRRHTDATHARALALLDELIAIGRPAAAPSAGPLPRPGTAVERMSLC